MLAVRTERLEDRVLLTGVAAQVDTFDLSTDTLLESTTSVLDNDSGAGLTAQLITNPESGQLSFSADGTFSYTPNSGWSGTDSFTYEATDGTDTSTATVYLHVVETSTAEDPGSLDGEASDPTSDGAPSTEDESPAGESSSDGSAEGDSGGDDGTTEAAGYDENGYDENGYDENGYSEVGDGDSSSDGDPTGENESTTDLTDDSGSSSTNNPSGDSDAGLQVGGEESSTIAEGSGDDGEESLAPETASGATNSLEVLPEFMTTEQHWASLTSGTTSFDGFWLNFQPTISALVATAASYGAGTSGTTSQLSDPPTTEGGSSESIGEPPPSEATASGGSTLGQAYAVETARIRRAYEERTAAIEATRQADVASAQRGFTITKYLADAILAGISSAADLVLSLRSAAIESTYQQEVAAADGTYDLRMAAAAETYASNAGEASGTLQRRLAEIVSKFAQTVGTAQQTRDSAVPAGIQFNPWGHLGDAIYTAAASVASTARQTRIDEAIEAYRDSMAELELAYQSAMILADFRFAADTALADIGYDKRVAKANEEHSVAAAGAERKFQEATAPLRSTLEQKVATAEGVLDRAFIAAETAHSGEVTSATEERDRRLEAANREFDDWMADAPVSYAAVAQPAARKLAEDTINANRAYRQAVDEANATHRGIVNSAAEANQGIGDPFLDFGVEVVTPAHDELNAFSAEQYEIYQTGLAEGGSEPDLRAALLSAVVEFAASKIGNFSTQYVEATRSVYESVADWVRQVAEADYNLAVALAEAGADHQKALEVAQADYIETLAGKEQSLATTYEQKLAAKTRAISEAEAAFERRIASADAQMATAKAGANHTYAVAVADAEKEFADKYTDAWEVREAKLSTAAATRSNALSTAASQWVDDIVAADQRWVTSVIEAADAYEGGAAAEYTKVIGEIVGAVEDYSETMLPEWEAAIRRYHSPEAFPDLSSGDLDAAINAWTTYENTVVREWASAHTAAAGAVNTYYSRMQAASNDRLDAEAHASQTRAQDIDTARAKAATEATAADQQYDSTIRTAVAGRARVLAQAEHTRSTAAAAAEETAVTDSASAYATARTDQANADETYAVGVANLTETLRTGLITTAYGELETLNQESRQLSEAAAEKIESNAREEAGRIRDARNRVAQTSIGWQLRAAGDAGQRAAEAAAAARAFIADPANTYSIPITAYPTSYALHIWEEFYNVPQAGNILNDAAAQLWNSLSAHQDEPSSNPQAAADVLGAMLGFQPGVRTALHDLSGDLIGMLDPDTGLVQRYGEVPGEPGTYVARYRSYEDVLAWGDLDEEAWNAVFGFATIPSGVPPLPDTQTIAYSVITFLIPQETLLSQETSDFTVALTLAVGGVGLVDVTGVTSVAAAGINLSQGHYGQAVADVAVPIGIGKLFKYIKRVKPAKLQQAIETIGTKADDVATKLDEATDGAAAVAKGVFIAPGVSRSVRGVDGEIQQFPIGIGSTARTAKGTTTARNVREQLAIQQVLAKPSDGRVLPIRMSDARWHESDAWLKMSYTVDTGGSAGPIDVHYVLNALTNEVDDLKIVLPGAR